MTATTAFVTNADRYNTGDPDGASRHVLQHLADALSVDQLLAHHRYDRLDITMVSGAAGVALFQHYYARTFRDERAYATSLELLQIALNQMSHGTPAPWLYAGYTGIAWVVAHLQAQGEDALTEIDLEEVDQLVQARVAQVPWTDDYDLLQGVVGLGVYALERRLRGGSVSLLEDVVDRLHEVSEKLPSGRAWFTPPWLLGKPSDQHHPEGLYNFGLAHGIPGVLAFLARTIEVGVAVDRATMLLREGVRWLTTHVQTSPEGPYLANWMDPAIHDAVRQPGRTAWCYGSPGAAIALMRCADVLNDQALRTLAIDLAMRSAEIPVEKVGAVDAGICHGAAGLAHLYRRLAVATGLPAFETAADLWRSQTHTYFDPSNRFGGFRQLRRPEGVEEWADAPGLLEGAAGVGLVLLDHSSTESLAWDRVLLTDSPVAARLEAR